MLPLLQYYMQEDQDEDDPLEMPGYGRGLLE
jgi:hypothetical protein